MISIRCDILAAALHFCGNGKDHRPYLAGVNIDPRGYVMATDGYIGFIAKLDGDAPEQPFTIPADVLKVAVAGYKRDWRQVPARMGVERGSIAGKPFVPLEMQTRTQYPDAHRVFPSECNGVTGQFNLEPLARVRKAAVELHEGRGKGNGLFHLFHNGEGPAGVRFHGREDCRAVVMPFKGAFAAHEWRMLK
jgi:hypothetical protein